MADIREYKCPACGGAMEFDSKTQKMKCPYCDTVADLSDFEETQSEKTASKEGAEQGETQEAAEYVDENALSVTIKRLRDKLGAQKYIKTVYGIGYSWVTKDE